MDATSERLRAARAGVAGEEESATSRLWCARRAMSATAADD